LFLARLSLAAGLFYLLELRRLTSLILLTLGLTQVKPPALKLDRDSQPQLT